MKTTIILLLLLLWVNKAYTQANNSDLIQLATQSSGLFIGKRPLHIRLNIQDTSQYTHWLFETTSYRIDSISLNEIIQNSLEVDTSSWQDNELKGFILISDRKAFIDSKRVLRKWSITDRAEERRYRKAINKFNYTDAFNRNVYYFSRPVFDNHKKFAVIAFNNGYGLSGGGAVTLFKFDNGSWVKIGDISRWFH